MAILASIAVVVFFFGAGAGEVEIPSGLLEPPNAIDLSGRLPCGDWEAESSDAPVSVFAGSGVASLGDWRVD